MLDTILAFLLLAPAIASGHSGEGTTTVKSVPEFVWLGVTHMLLGWDHLLFVAGVALIAGTVRQAAGYASLFTLGHTITLIAAALTEWRVSPVKVDLVIGLSVVFVGAVAFLGRPRTALHRHLFGTAVLGFGFVHGLGLATPCRTWTSTGLAASLASSRSTSASRAERSLHSSSRSSPATCRLGARASWAGGSRR